MGGSVKWLSGRRCSCMSVLWHSHPPSLLALYLSLLKSRYHRLNPDPLLFWFSFPWVGGRVSLEVVAKRQWANDSKYARHRWIQNQVIIYLASLTASFGKAVLKAICSAMSLPNLERYLSEHAVSASGKLSLPCQVHGTLWKISFFRNACLLCPCSVTQILKQVLKHRIEQGLSRNLLLTFCICTILQKPQKKKKPPQIPPAFCILWVITKRGFNNSYLKTFPYSVLIINLFSMKDDYTLFQKQQENRFKKKQIVSLLQCKFVKNFDVSF